VLESFGALANNGELNIKSQLDEGMTVTVMLPSNTP
jgi:hypothetical protein